MKTIICFLLMALGAAAAADPANDEQLRRVSEIRAKFEQDQLRDDQEGMAHVPLANAAMDSPTVTDMRREMGASMTQIQHNYRCMKIDVDNTAGNTTVICGDSNGNVTSEHTTADRDVITLGDKP